MNNAGGFSITSVASANDGRPSNGLARFATGMAFALTALATPVCAAEPPATPPQTPPAGRAIAQRPTATLSDVPYGAHPRQVLDFWKAPGTKPTPVVFHIHGGGWGAGNKGATRETAAFLAAGISVVSISYRYTWQAIGDGIKPAVAAPMHDAARALQLVRSKAKEWNIDPQRIAATGTSAGACTGLWLAFHNDMADPKSADPIAHESTRLYCVAVDTAQTSLDPKQMKEWTPNIDYGATAFNFADPTPTQARAQSLRFADFLAHRDEILPWIKEYSPIEHASRDDPPIYMIYPTPPGVGLPQPDATHSTNFGVKLQERLEELKVKCELVYPGATDVKHPTIQVYLIEKLRPAP